MYKKIIMACMAIAAFAAFVVAPAASATTLTSGVVPVPVGTSITAANTGNTTFTGAFNVVCDHVHLTGIVTQNNGTAIKGEITTKDFFGTGTNTDCTSALGSTKVTVNSKLCIETITGTDTVKTTGCGANVTFTLEITGTGPCKYSTASVSGTFTTSPAEATVNISKQPAKKHEGGIFCPGEGELDMDFDLYTTGAKITETGPQLTIS